VKRGDLLRHLRKHGCHLKREGRSHSLWTNPATGALEAIPRHAPLTTDVVIKKRRWSAFYETELDAHLRSLGTQYIIVTGCTTSMCIESTIRDAAFRDYVCVLPADCTGQPARHDATYSGHAASLKIIEMSFGWVSNSQHIRRALAGSDD